MITPPASTTNAAPGSAISHTGHGGIKVDEGIIYTEVDKGGKCSFGEVFITDGRIAANDLTVVEDDKSFFPKYNPALNVLPPGFMIHRHDGKAASAPAMSA